MEFNLPSEYQIGKREKVVQLLKDKKVVEVFGAIDVTLKLVEKPRPICWKYDSRGSIGIPLFKGKNYYTTLSPVVTWKLDNKKIIIHYEKDHSIRYPVTMVVLVEKEEMVSLALGDEGELLDELHEILHSI